MSKKYKYWFFYIDDEYLDIIYIEEPGSNLYAYTDNYDIAIKFKKTRNMRIFTMKEKILSRIDVNRLIGNFQREQLIEVNCISSLMNVRKSTFKYKIVMTQMEHTNIQNIIQHLCVKKLWDNTWINPKIFKDKYFESLYAIGFGYGYDMISDNTNVLLHEFISNTFTIDILSVFIDQYRFLLNKELLK